MIEFDGRTSYFKRSKNERGNYDRRSYYVDIRFSLKTLQTDLSMKIDTGASRTVIGINNTIFDSGIKDIILQEPVCSGRLESATNGEICYHEVVVDDFYLTPDIKFTKIKLAFSEDIGNRALLGMDILSLFSFTYNRREQEFWLADCDTANKYVEKYCLNKELGYIDPSLIAEVNGTSSAVGV